MVKRLSFWMSTWLALVLVEFIRTSPLLLVDYPILSAESTIGQLAEVYFLSFDFPILSYSPHKILETVPLPSFWVSFFFRE